MPDTETTKPSRLAKIRWLLWLLVAAAGALVLILAVRQNDGAQQPAEDFEKAFGGPFQLTAPDGTVVTNETLAGKPYAIFFGFTRCPDVCPTSLARMARLRTKLGRDGMKFNIVFVSVDPEHDKPADIGSYVELFGTPIIGLTGTEAQLAQIKKGFGVYSAKVPQEGGDYLIDHTAAIYLIDAKGGFAGTIDHHENEAASLDKLKMLVG